MPAVRRNELDGEHAVRGQTVLADHPVEAAAERVADDADVRRRACEIRKAVLARRVRDLHSRALRPRPVRADPPTSISSPRIRSVFRSRASLLQSIGPALWPPALNAIRRPCSPANRTVSTTSWTDSGKTTATAAGRPPGSTTGVPRPTTHRAGRTTSPDRRFPSAAVFAVWSVVISISSLVDRPESTRTHSGNQPAPARHRIGV